MLRRYALPQAALVCLMLLGALLASFAQPTQLVRAAATVATCAPDSGSATISGTVTGSGGTPLNSVLVTAYTIYGKHGGSAYTNASGVYQLTGLIGAAYLLKFEPQDGAYVAEWYPNQPTPQAASPLAVAEAGAVPGVNAQLEFGARISGTVTGASSGPLQGLAVTVYDTSGQSVARAYTDATGTYVTSPGLPSGSYRVGFAAGSGFLAAFSNNKPSLETADPVELTAPDLRSAVNATLARGGSISGQVTSAATGLPISGVSVYASGQNGSDGDYTDAMGRYTITGLGSGDYSVSASPSSEGVNLLDTPQNVTVAAPDTRNSIDFALTVGGTLTGRVTDSGDAPLNGITVFLSNSDGSYQRYVYTNTAGVYSATALPSGAYRVFFRPSRFIPEAYNNQPSFSDAEPVVVTAPSTVTGIDAVLQQGGAVSGTVTDATSGAPIKNIFVEVLDERGSRVETANTQADGTYQTGPTLPSGSYLVRFNADGRFASCAYVTEYHSDAATKADADAITISAPTAATNINAALTRGSLLFGKLTDATTGAPIISGQVTIYNAAGTFAMFGRLSFLGGWSSDTALPSGSYRVKFSDYDDGYVDEFYNDQLSLDTATPVVLSAPADQIGLDAALTPGAIISGRVTAADTGAPFTAGSVRVYAASGAEVGYAEISRDGSYTVRTGLASGSYRVGVVPDSAEGEGSPATARREQAEQDSVRSAYSTTYYGRAVTLSGAAPVALAAPTTTAAINIAMLRSLWLPLQRR